MKIHLLRSARSTWCGRKDIRSLREQGAIVEHGYKASCLTCIKADLAEAKRNHDPAPEPVA